MVAEALLITKCRCSRRVAITYPPPPEILIPIEPKAPLFWGNEGRLTAAEIPTMAYRRFERELRSYGQSPVRYFEVSTYEGVKDAEP